MFLFFVVEFHYVTLTGFIVAVWTRVAPDSQRSIGFCFPSAGIKDGHYYTRPTLCFIYTKDIA